MSLCHFIGAGSVDLQPIWVVIEIMNTIDLSQSLLSLLPPMVALTLAIVTRRVLLSLGTGIVLGALLLTDFQWMSTLGYLSNKIMGLFISDGGINTWNMSIVAFLVILGAMTALLTLSGGTRAFANWAQSRIKTQRQARLLTAFLGMFIFIDDYFNSLAVGAIARPVTDRFRISRTKLAYILDSTAAPICVIMPASSWGAYIITLIGGILTLHGITEYSPLTAFLTLIPMNFYAIFALAMVFMVAWFGLNVGAMKRHELAAANPTLKTNEENDQLPNLEDESNIEASEQGRVFDLILPISALIAATFFFLIFTGYQSLQASDLPFSILGAFENTDVGMSLCYGGLVGLSLSLIGVFRQRLSVRSVATTCWIGGRSMFGAILILLFAWSIGGVIGDMETGKFLSSLVQGNINPAFLPVILFLLSGAMAFSTGTSWGTFGIMLPIAGDLSASTEIALLLPMLGSVLAGAVFGDHCSPISDTTILSSTGARCDHIDHVATQLPYSLGVAFVAAIGFLVLGFTQSTLWAFMAALVIFIVVCALFYWRSQVSSDATSADEACLS